MGKRYYIERFAQAILTVYIVTTVSFFMLRAMPGGPVDYIKAQLITSQRGKAAVNPHMLERLTEVYTNLSPDEPLYIQYLDYMQAIIFRLDFGVSTWYQKPVTEVLFWAMPWTLYLFSMALILSFTIRVGLGGAMAYAEGSRFDIGATIFALINGSTPYYITAILGVYILGYQFEIFPTQGHYTETVSVGLAPAFVGSVLWHAALPIASLALAATAGAISMRANAIRILGKDYIRVGKLRGLPSRRLVQRYVARNAVLPEYTSLLISMGGMFGGSVILETIFVYPGVGFYTFKAVETRDYPLMMGGFILVTVTTVTGVLIADLTYGIIDPRASTGSQREGY